MVNTRIHALFSGLLLLVFASALCAQQTTNNVLHAVPTPGKVVIDGKLNDWDLSGQFDVFANMKMRTSYSTKVAAMYDKDYFYLSILWRDPTPMVNMIDSRFDIGSGWRSDCLQLRLRTDLVMHVDCWYSTAADHPVINISYGGFYKNPNNPRDVSNLESIKDAITLGAKEAFLLGDDKRSYTQEIAFPWKMITGNNAIVKATGKPFAPPTTFNPGDSFSMGMEFLWGGPDGKTWPVHRYADLLKEGQTSREFFWTAENAWGTVKLEPKGNLKLPAPDYGESGYLQQTSGPVKLQYTMPFDGYATIVIEDAQGRRVRNLIGMAPRNKGKQLDYWDGADDNGKMVPPGNYHWRGLIHQGINPVYDASFGTPGTPPWDNANNSGAWMSDHNPPTVVAAGKNQIFLAAEGSEAGWALISTDLNGKKLWGERKFQGIRDLATDDAYLYAAINTSWDNPTPPFVGRLEAKTGKYAPFATKAEPQLTVPVAVDGENARIAGIDVTTDRLAVALTSVNVIRFFEKKTMQKLGEVAVPGVGEVAYDDAGTLFALSNTQIVRVDGTQLTPVVTTGLQQPHSLAIDHDGRFIVTERATHQVKVFDKDGTLIRAIGEAGGRPLPGKWLTNSLRNPAGVDVDVQGRIWVAEENLYPKRVSVWTEDGQLVKDYMGPTTYGGMGACADSMDKTRVFGSGCEYKLDYAKNQVTAVANLLDDNFTGELLRFQGHEYFMARRNELYIRRGDAFVKVAQFGRTTQPTVDAVRQSQEKQGGPVGFAWSDRNDNGEIEQDEIIFQTGADWNTGYWGGYWLDESFNMYVLNKLVVQKFALQTITPGGAPIWDMTKPTIYGKSGEQLLFADKGRVITTGDGTIRALEADGSTRWSYPQKWNSVHGSHLAPIPESDAVLVGVLGPIGMANSPVGRLFAMNSNMGRLYLMTTDGLLVGSVFQDNRSGAEPWPDDAKPGTPMGGVTMGAEWFGGYFFKSNPTNEYYLIAGGTSYNMIRLDGMSTLQSLKGNTFKLTAQQLTEAEQLHQQRAAAKAQANTLTIARVTKAPVIDGKLDDFPTANMVKWSAGSYAAQGGLATDGTKLYLAYQVDGDVNPMINNGQDSTMLFITGDSVDLQLGTDPTTNPKRLGAAKGDIRLLISMLNQQPVAVLYRYRTDDKKYPQRFTCPWRYYDVDSVEVLPNEAIAIVRQGHSYVVEAAIPLAKLGFTLEPGKSYKADLGVIYSNAEGTNRAARVYWSNKATGLTSDVPGEIMPSPNLWGTATLAE